MSGRPSQRPTYVMIRCADPNLKYFCLKDDPDYDFHACVRKYIFTKAGCRPPWDIWYSSILDVCNYLGQYDKIEKMEWSSMWSDKTQIANATGCLVPCKYKEYKAVGHPRKSSNKLWGNKMEKG